MIDSPLNSALRRFEATEANLAKAEKALARMEAGVPQGIAFGNDPDYDDACRSFLALIAALPKIDGWKPDIRLMDLDEIAQHRFDAQEAGEIEAVMSVERQIAEPSKQLREYRYKFIHKRRQLVRDALDDVINAVDGNLRDLAPILSGDKGNEDVTHPAFEGLKEQIAQIATLIGSSVQKPPRWGDLHRHLYFGMTGDLHDIIKHDWPAVKTGLRETMYGEDEPLPIDVDDLGALVSTKPRGAVATRLSWDKLSEEDFERLMFALISSEGGYENPEWLMKTTAPDRGRDLSVWRVHADSLGGTIRHRVIIQCKHWLTKSVSPAEISTLREQMKLWEPPRVDIHIIATSGRFTSDAVALVERHNQSDTALRIEMWPESHLERLLASRPALIAQFGLR